MTLHRIGLQRLSLRGRARPFACRRRLLTSLGGGAGGALPMNPINSGRTAVINVVFAAVAAITIISMAIIVVVETIIIVAAAINTSLSDSPSLGVECPALEPFLTRAHVDD